MHKTQFWQLIDQSRLQATQLNQTHAQALTDLMHALPVSDVVDFENLFTHYFHQAYDWKLWGAAYLIHGGCSDDGFMDFRAWLIGQGEAMYKAVLGNPDVLAQSIDDEDDLFVLESQDIWSVASAVYQERTGKDSMGTDSNAEFPSEPKGQPWQEDDLVRLLPNLAAKFEY